MNEFLKDEFPENFLGDPESTFDFLTEQVSSLLKPGTKFERDIRKITNQSTFKQYLDSAGISDTITKPIYELIPRFRAMADLFPDKSWLWKSLYLGCIYKALVDHQVLSNKL